VFQTLASLVHILIIKMESSTSNAIYSIDVVYIKVFWGLCVKMLVYCVCGSECNM